MLREKRKSLSIELNGCGNSQEPKLLLLLAWIRSPLFFLRSSLIPQAECVLREVLSKQKNRKNFNSLFMTCARSQFLWFRLVEQQHETVLSVTSEPSLRHTFLFHKSLAQRGEEIERKTELKQQAPDGERKSGEKDLSRARETVLAVSRLSLGQALRSKYFRNPLSVFLVDLSQHLLVGHSFVAFRSTQKKWFPICHGRLSHNNNKRGIFSI